jgi:hypothetical protein
MEIYAIIAAERKSGHKKVTSLVFTSGKWVSKIVFNRSGQGCRIMSGHSLVRPNAPLASR